jgi:hypothetical protein
MALTDAPPTRREAPTVGQKTVRFSDLSGEIITDDAPARIVIHEHPELGGGSVEIDVMADEALTAVKAAVQVAVLDVYLPGEDEPRRVALEAADFDALGTDTPMTELLASARPARRASRAASASPAKASPDKAGFATLDTAGRPHKGRITEAEQRFVREHFDEINERLAAEGLRPIDLDDPIHVERYDLGELAAKRTARPAASAAA